MYTEDKLLPISALQHFAFCERQWALIHLEGVWEENLLTAEGQLFHNHAHEAETEVRGNLRIARGLRLRSLRLGLVGKADVVEFHRLKKNSIQLGVLFEGAPGCWKPVIVEYKRGKPKLGHEDDVQVCAQALCLEEMLAVILQSGSIFYGKPRRRHDVIFNNALREETESLVIRLHDLTRAGDTPLAEYSKKCRSCSLLNLCLPRITDKGQSVRRYLSKAIAEAEDNTL
jgi:CRISPR-associated exonuclease Cas4